MNYVLEIIQTELLIACILYEFTNYKITIRFYSSVLCGVAIVLLADHYNCHKIVGILLILVLQIAPTIIGVKYTSLKKILYINICCISIVSLIYSIVLFIAGALNHQVTSNRFLEHSICFIIVFVIVLLLKNKLIHSFISEIGAMSKKIKIPILLYICGLEAIIIGLSALFRLNLSSQFRIAIILLLFFTTLVSIVVVFLLISESISNNYNVAYNKMMQEKLCDDVKHIEKITTISEDLRQFRHDINNMALGIRTCLNSNNIEAAKDYLDDFDEAIDCFDCVTHTGNSFLDSVLSNKTDILTEYNIRIEFEGLMPTDSLRPIDICVVFGNALDNAIEACQKLPRKAEKTIRITVKQKANVLFVRITNPVVCPVRIQNNTIVSTKKTAGHGMGINSMNKIVKNYNGQLVLKCDEIEFVIEMSFVLECSKASNIN